MILLINKILILLNKSPPNVYNLTNPKSTIMKNSKFFLVLILFIAFNANAQLTKGNWLVGGTGSLNYTKIIDKQQPMTGSSAILISTVTGSYSILLEPSIGYFIKNRFAVGLKLNFINGFTEGTTFSIKESNLSISPFVRYYFLNEEKNFNIFFEPSYFYETNSFGNSNAFSLKAGHVIFFNSSVGFETSINYIRAENKQFTSDRIFIGFGIQIHLEKK